jgi:hypothetical protein
MSRNKIYRSYFYTICHKGRLYPFDVKHKNLTTCLKDPYFIDFFFRPKHLKRIHELKPRFKYTIDHLIDSFKMKNRDEFVERYPYVSLCAGEMNFINVEETVHVFHDYDSSRDVLRYAGDLLVSFQPDTMVLSDEGKLYHKSPLEKYGLISSQVMTNQWKDNFDFSAQMEDENAKYIQFVWKDKIHDIEILPSDTFKYSNEIINNF